MSKVKMSLVKAVRLVVARKIVGKIHPRIATEREVAAIRGRATTVEEIESAKDVLRCGQTFYENYYELLNQTTQTL